MWHAQQEASWRKGRGVKRKRLRCVFPNRRRTPFLLRRRSTHKSTGPNYIILSFSLGGQAAPSAFGSTLDCSVLFWCPACLPAIARQAHKTLSKINFQERAQQQQNAKALGQKFFQNKKAKEAAKYIICKQQVGAAFIDGWRWWYCPSTFSPSVSAESESK